MKRNLAQRMLAIIIILLIVFAAMPTTFAAEATNLRLASYGDLTVDGYLLEPEQRGTDVVLYAGATNDNEAEHPISYQWYRITENGYGKHWTVEPERELIEGATQQSYTIKNVSAADTGSYYCVITDGVETIEHGCTVFFNSLLSWSVYPENIVAKVGEKVELKAEASSENGDVSFEWFVWEDGNCIIKGQGDIYEITSVSQEDYGYWYCRFTDGYTVGFREFTITPGATVSMDISEYKVVNGETIEIKASAEAVSFGEEEEDKPTIGLGKCVLSQDEDGTWRDDLCDEIWLISDVEGDGTEWEYVLDGNCSATAQFNKTDNSYNVDIKITINNISSVWDGKYLICVDDYFENSDKIYFEISVEDYGIRIVNNGGYELSGELHPGATLWIEPLAQKQTRAF